MASDDIQTMRQDGIDDNDNEDRDEVSANHKLT
jgi:hypothetical protein